MKKLLVILFISILTIFIIPGCTDLGTLPDSEGEGKNENGMVNLEIERLTKIDGWRYITVGSHT
jgi:hypothetical protein